MANVVETIYRFRADRAAAAEVLRENERINESLEQIEKSSNRLRETYSDLETASVRTARARVDALQTELKLVREQADVYGTMSRRIMPLAGLTSGLGGAALSGRMMIAADILDAAEALTVFKAELPSFASQLGIGRRELVALGAAGAALAVELAVIKSMFSDLVKAAKNTTAVVSGQIDAYARFRDFMLTATSESLKAEIESVMKRDLAEREYYDNILELRNRVNAALETGQPLSLEGLAEGAIRLYEFLGGSATGLKELNAALAESRKNIESNRLYLQLLIDAYSEGATAANDAAQREQEYTERRIAGLEKEMQRELQIRQMIESGSIAQAEQRLEQIEQESELLRELESELAPLSANSETAAQKLQEVRDRLAELGLEASAINERVIPAIRFAEQWKNGIENFKSGVQSAIKSVADIAQRLQKGAEIIAKADQRELEIRAEFAAEREKIERQHNEKIRSLQEQSEQRQREFYERYVEQVAAAEEDLKKSLSKLQEDYNREELRRAEDFRRDQERAERQHKQNVLEAAARLDATAVWQEQQRYEEERRQAEEDFRIETQRRKEELQIQINQERAAFQERIAQARKAYEQQLRDEREQLQRSIAQQNAAYRAELQQLNSALQARLQSNQAEMQAELNSLLGFQNYEYTVRETHYAKLKAQLDRWFASQTAVPAIATAASRVASGIQTATRDAFSALGRLFDTGGYTPDGIIMARKGEFVLDPVTVRTLERGLGAPLTQSRIRNIANSYGPITVQQTFGDIGRYSPSQIQSIVERSMLRVFQQLGA